MRAKYFSRVHPVMKRVQARDSHTWKRMLSVWGEVEGVLSWRLFQGQVSLWWDNWSGLKPLGHEVPGVSYSHAVIAYYVVDGQLDLAKFDGLLPPGLAADLSWWGQGPSDVPIWHAASNGMFSFSSAKSLLCAPLPPSPDPMLGQCLHKHLSKYPSLPNASFAGACR